MSEKSRTFAEALRQANEAIADLRSVVEVPEGTVPVFLTREDWKFVRAALSTFPTGIAERPRQDRIDTALKEAEA